VTSHDTLTDKAIVFGTAHDHGTVIVGDYGTATAGDTGTAIAGYRGTATAGDPIAAAKAAIEEAIAKSIALSTPVTIQWTPDVEDELRARPDFGHAVATRRHLTPTSLEVCGGGSGQEGMWRLILEQAAD